MPNYFINSQFNERLVKLSNVYFRLHSIFFFQQPFYANLGKWKRLFGNFDPNIHVLLSRMRLMFSEDLDGHIPTPALAGPRAQNEIVVGLW